MRLSPLAAVAAVALMAASAPASAGVMYFNFNSVSGSTTPFTLDGATFTSPSDPGAYTVGPNAGLFSTLSSTVLSSAGVPAVLDIRFATPVTTLSFNFGLGDLFGGGTSGPDTLTFTPNVGTAVTTTATLTVGDFPQGTVSYSGAPFSSVTIDSAYAIAIGNLETVPEPTSFALLGAGLLGLAAIRRRA